MKFKQNEEQKREGMSRELYHKFIVMIQLEINKLSYINSAKMFFYNTGQMNYKKFFKYLYTYCDKLKSCMIGFLTSQMEEIPGFQIPAFEEIKSTESAFEKMVSYEEQFIDLLNETITQACEDKNWIAFNYLIKKLDDIDHICCRALEAVKNNADVLQLLPCEQHSKEN